MLTMTLSCKDALDNLQDDICDLDELVIDEFFVDDGWRNCKRVVDINVQTDGLSECSVFSCPIHLIYVPDNEGNWWLS